MEERFQKQNGYAAIVKQIRALIDQRARQVLVSIEAETARGEEMPLAEAEGPTPA